MSALEAVLFDMNGVIVDDEQIHELACAHVLADFGRRLDHRSYQQHFVGRTDEDGFRSYFSGTPAVRYMDQLIAAKRDEYRALATGALKPCPGALACIASLVDSEVKLALVTSSTRREARRVLETLRLTSVFHTCITAEDVRIGKPDPQAYLLAARALIVDPPACVVVEDAPSGIEAARKAGMRCLGVTTTHPPEELREADRIVVSLSGVGLKDFWVIAETLN
jgi:HAD superfamily hydrolase (TIGR01509 family)